MTRYTPVEARIDALAHRLLADSSETGARARLVEFLVFGAKQAWACVYVFDIRWFLVAAIVAVYARTVMHFRVFRSTFRMPVLLAFLLVALFIWIAENIATAAGAWIYPHQEAGWVLVPLTKLVAWYLLMMISVVLVTVVYPPKAPTTHT